MYTFFFALLLDTLEILKIREISAKTMEDIIDERYTEYRDALSLALIACENLMNRWLFFHKNIHELYQHFKKSEKDQQKSSPMSTRQRNGLEKVDHLYLKSHQLYYGGIARVEELLKELQGQDPLLKSTILAKIGLIECIVFGSHWLLESHGAEASPASELLNDLRS